MDSLWAFIPFSFEVFIGSIVMAKTKIEFVCKECGASHQQWENQCLVCKEYNTLEDINKKTKKSMIGLAKQHL